MSDLSHAPLEILSAPPYQHWVSVPQTCSGFNCLCPGWASAWDVLPIYTWELSYNFQDLDQTSLECETIPEPVPLGSRHTIPPSFLVSSSTWLRVYVLMSSSRAEAVSVSCLHPSCPTPMLNKCLMSDWRKECSSSENGSSEPCTSALPRDVFIKCGCSVSVSNTVLIHPEHQKFRRACRG